MSSTGSPTTDITMTAMISTETHAATKKFNGVYGAYFNDENIGPSPLILRKGLCDEVRCIQPKMIMNMYVNIFHNINQYH